MPRKKHPCPDCGFLTLAKKCRKCALPYERTPEIRAKMSVAHKGKRHNYRSASSRPEVAAKIRQSWTPEKREAARQRGLKFAADQAWRDLIARSVAGELNPNHQGKDQATGYAPGWGRLHRRLIRERDGHRCVQCGSTGRLDTHHKDGSKTNHHPDNLVTLCRRCHANQPIDRRNKFDPR